MKLTHEEALIEIWKLIDNFGLYPAAVLNKSFVPKEPKAWVAAEDGTWIRSSYADGYNIAACELMDKISEIICSAIEDEKLPTKELLDFVFKV